MVRRPPRKVTYFEPVAPRLGRNTVIESTFEVGRRFRCTMRIDCSQLDPGAVIRPGEMSSASDFLSRMRSPCRSETISRSQPEPRWSRPGGSDCISHLCSPSSDWFRCSPRRILCGLVLDFSIQLSAN